MVNDENLIKRLMAFDQAMAIAEETGFIDYANSCVDCGDKYHSSLVGVTGDNCPCCYKEREFGIIPGETPVIIDTRVSTTLNGHREYQTPHPSFEAAVKASEDSGVVFGLAKKL